MSREYPELLDNVANSLLSRLRWDAEKIVRESGEEITFDYQADTQRLVHELQVHQVELEIQNQELRKSQFELEASRDRYSNLFEFSPIGYLILDSNLLVTKANVAAGELLEESTLDLIGRTFSRFITEPDADRFYLHCRKVRATGETETCDLELALPNGTVRFVQLHSALLRLPEAEEQTFTIALSDITEREETRRKLQQAQELLETRVQERTQELASANSTLTDTTLELRKLSRAVEQSRSTVVITDRNGLIEYVNSRFTELTGYCLDEVRGKKPGIVSSGATAEQTYRELWTSISSGREWHGTFQNRKKSGEPYWEEECISPIADENGEITHYLSVGEDITVRKAAEERQQLLMRELDHRVKNTLSIVLSITKQTLRSNSDFAAFRVSFEGRVMALAEVHRLLMKNRWEALLLEDLVNPSLKPYIGSSGPTAVVTGPAIRLGPNDAQSLHLIFHELTTNAAKYGALSLPTGRVEVNWEVQESNGKMNVRLQWLETGGPEVVEPKNSGFGSDLIERIVTGGLAGSMKSQFAASGFQWEALFPLPEVSASVLAIPISAR